MTDDANRLMVQQIPHLRRYARALTGGIDSADDLVQDCLERAWSRIHRWRPGSDMRCWLFTIMHNVNANRVRAESRRPTVVAFEDGRDGRGIGPAQEHRAAISPTPSRRCPRINARRCFSSASRGCPTARRRRFLPSPRAR